MLPRAFLKYSVSTCRGLFIHCPKEPDEPAPLFLVSFPSKIAPKLDPWVNLRIIHMDEHCPKPLSNEGHTQAHW